MSQHRCVRKWLLNLSIFIPFTVACYLVVLEYNKEWRLFCSTGEVEHAVDSVCSDFASGIVQGNLCNEFCQTRTIVPAACKALHYGKEVVFVATWSGEGAEPLQVIVKGSYTGKVRAPEKPPDWNALQGLVRKKVLSEHGTELAQAESQKLLSKIYGHSQLPQEKTDQSGGFAGNLSQSEALEGEWKSWWGTLSTLLDSKEFIHGVIYEEENILPKIYGTCGRLIFEEVVEGLPLPGLWEKTSIDMWRERLKKALDILAFLDRLETGFPEPLHYCDVKREHFGIKNTGIKILDSDYLMKRTELEMILGPDKKCSNHSDCFFFDCQSRCNLASSTCEGRVYNNNLQVVCEQLFLGRHRGHVIQLPGLLSSRFLAGKFKYLLESCANPDEAMNFERIGANGRTRKDLEQHIKYLLDEL